MPFDENLVIAREMYDYIKDPQETENVLAKPEYQNDRKKMEQLFLGSMKRELVSCESYSKIADYHEPLSTSK